MNDITEDDIRAALREDAGTAWATDEGWDRIRSGGEKQVNRRRNRFVMVGATLTAAAAVLAGVVVVASGDDKEPVVAQGPQCSAAGLPPTVRGPAGTEVSLATAIAEAAVACDYDALRALMADDFTYSTIAGAGIGYDADSTIESWRFQEGQGLTPLAVLVETLATEPFCADFGSEDGCVWTYMERDFGVAIAADDTWSAFQPATSPVAPAECETVGSTGTAVIGSDTVSHAALATAQQILDAAMACDYEALRALMADDFTYSFGDASDPDLAVEAWRTYGVDGLGNAGDDVFQALVDRLTAGTLGTDADGQIVTWNDPDGEYRIGIRTDGTWIYAVAGD